MTYASSIPSSLYPKVLVKKNLEDLGDAIWLTLLITLPIASFIALYAEPICAVLGTKYLPAAWPLRAFLLASVMQAFSRIAVISYLGLEGKDASSISQRELLRSAVFKNDLVDLSVNAVYIVLLAISSCLLYDPVEVSLVWGLSMAASFTVSLLILVKLLRADFSQSFPFGFLLRTGSKIMLPAVPLSILPIIFPIGRLDTLWVLLPLLILHILIYFSAYFGLLYALMPKFRSTLAEARRSLGSALHLFSGNSLGDRSQENVEGRFSPPHNSEARSEFFFKASPCSTPKSSLSHLAG